MKFLNTSLILFALISSTNGYTKHEKGKLLRGRRELESSAVEIELNQKTEYLRQLKHSSDVVGTSTKKSASTDIDGKSITSSNGSSKIKSVKCGSKKGGIGCPGFDLFGTPFDTAFPIDLLDIDNKMNGDGDAPATTSTVESVTQPKNGSLTQSPTVPGSFVYTPNPGFIGTDTFEFTVVDGAGTVSTGAVTINVDAPNNAPRAINDSFDVEENEDVDVDVSQLLANDIDIDGDVLQISSCTSPQNGQIKTKKDGSFTYTPNDNFLGTDSVTCTIMDGRGGTDTSDVTFNVNSPQFTADDTYTTTTSTPLIVNAPGILGNDEPGNNDVLTVTSCTDPSNGNVSVNAQGGLTYTPPASFTGVVSFQCTISNGRGGTDTSQVTINVIPRPPVDQLETDEDTPLTMSSQEILDNLVGSLNQNNVIANCNQPSNGSLVDNQNDSFTYIPTADFNGQDSFECDVTDTDGTTSTVIVPVLVNPSQDSPVSSGDNITTPMNAGVTFNPLSNDRDADGDTLEIDKVNKPKNGQVEENPDGTLTYTPKDGFVGVDEFTYTVTDGNGNDSTNTVRVQVEALPNSNPVAVDDNYNTDENVPITIDANDGVLSNDSDPDGDQITLASFTQPRNGRVSMNRDGMLRYEPNPGFSGEDVFEYVTSDGMGGADTATVTITVADDPDNSLAKEDEYSTTENTPVTITAANGVLNNDAPNVSVTSFSQPDHGTLTMTPRGSFTYEPDDNWSGEDEFQYSVSDGQGGLDTATVKMTVQPTNPGTGSNSAPQAEDEDVSTNENVPLLVDPTANDDDLNNDPLQVASFTQPTNGKVTLTPSGNLLYMPDEDFTGVDTFEYVVSDGNGGEDTGTVTVEVKVPSNTEPEAVDDNDYMTNTNTELVIPPQNGVLQNDQDPDGTILEVASFTQPLHGIVDMNEDGSFTYEPDPDWTGTDVFDYVLSDGEGGSDTGTVTVTVGPVGGASGNLPGSNTNTTPNVNPVAVDDSYTTPENTALLINTGDDVLLSNDSDQDGDVIQVTSFTQPEHGTVSIVEDGRFTYLPNQGYTGVDTFQYTITDSKGGQDTATVTITVGPDNTIPTNSDPVAVDDSYTTPENTALQVLQDSGLLSNDSDPDGDTLAVSAITQPEHGTVSVVSNGGFTYTPDQGYTGVDTFQYIATDSGGNQNTGAVTITVTPAGGGSALLPDSNTGTVPNTVPNVKPTAVDDSYSTSDNTPLQVSQVNGILSNDSDPDGDTLTVTSFTRPTHGTLTLQQNGAFLYEPDANWNGQDTFEYVVSDSKGGADTGTVTITVTPFVAAVDDEYTTFQGTVLSISAPGVLDNDRNFDSISGFTQPSHGQITLNPDGSFTYTPAPGFVGTERLEYTLVGSNGFTSTAQVSLTVLSLNVPPLINPSTNTVILTGGQAFAVAGVSSDCDENTFTNCDGVSTSSKNVGK